MKACKKLAMLFFVSLFSANSFAGLSVGATRVVFHGDEKETSLSVINSENSGIYLIRSWINADKGDAATPFVTTPPLFRIEPGQSNDIRIALKNNSLPQDRESVFWVNTLAIPPATKDKNSLQFSVNTRIKLFYRPASLDKRDVAASAYKSLRFSRNGKQLVIENPTPYFISFSQIEINGTAVKESHMVYPKSTLNIDNVPSGNKVTWKTINDFGGVTDTVTTNI